MKIEFTAEQLKQRDKFREFVKAEIIPLSAQNDRDEKMPSGMLKKMADQGYLGSMIPEKHGGLGFDMMTIGLLNEEFGKGCSSARSVLTVHGMVSLAVNRWGTEEQKNHWLHKFASGEAIAAFALTEPSIGSDANSIECEAVLSGDSYILNGKKKWITLGEIADVFLILAKVEGEASAFLVEKDSPGLLIKPKKGMLGMRASMGVELELSNCKISNKNLLGAIGTGISHIALLSLDYGRYTIACGCVGLGQACLDESVKYVTKRKQFGVRLAKHQLIMKMISEMTVEVKAARLLCYNAGYLKDVGDPDSIMETWVAKYYSSKMINKVTSDAVQIHGANGCSNDYPIERYFRDAKITEIIEGTSQIHEILIAMNMYRNRERD